LGLTPVEQFFPHNSWKHFELLRHQYAGHSTGAKATSERPARIVPATRLGRAIEGTGLADLEGFLKRISSEILPGVEKVRDDLTSRYPRTKKFLETYSLEIEVASKMSSDDYISGRV